MQQDDRVIVVGAGPVGAVTALALVKKGIPVTLLEGEAGAARGSARRHHSPADGRDAGRARAQGRSALPTTPAAALLVADLPFPRPRDRRARRRVRHQPAQGRSALPVRGAMGAVQAGARGAAAHVEGSGIAEVRFSTKVTGLAQGADHVDVTVINEGGESRDHPRPLRHRHRRRAAAPCARPGRHRVRGLHLARSASSRSAPASISARPARASAPATISPIPTSGSTCSRSKATARPASGAASCRCRADEIRRAGPEHGRHPAPPAGHPRQERRLRDPLPRALFRASAGGRDLQQGPRAARRRQRPCQQSHRRHGHERRHP